MKYDIIIPHYGVGAANNLARRCLVTIRDYSQDYRLIFVDNGNGGELRSELEQHDDVLLITNDTNLGFVKAVNQGIIRSSAEFVVIMNNDTEAVIDWLDKLRAPLVDNVGASGPRTTTLESWQGRWRIDHDQWPVCILSKNAMLAFFCVMIRKKVIDDVGHLDENYGVGLGDDDDYCRRIHRAGYRLALVQDLVIPHHHRSTFRTLYSESELVDMQNAAHRMLKRTDRRQR